MGTKINKRYKLMHEYNGACGMVGPNDVLTTTNQAVQAAKYYLQTFNYEKILILEVVATVEQELRPIKIKYTK